MLDKNVLYDLYVVQNKTGKEIAEIAKVKTPSTVYNWLDKYNIPRRENRDAQRCVEPSKDELYDLYVTKGMSMANIAKKIGSSESSISKLLDKFQIEKRDKSEKFGGWNKGVPIGDEERKRLSELAKKRTGKNSSRYGAELSDETKKKISNSLKGRFRKDKNPNWKKGGITKARLIINNRYEYKEWRKEVFERDNYACQDCGKPSNGNIQVHHIVPVHKDPSRVMDTSNAITLCKDCHRSIKGKERKHEKRYFEKINQPIQ